MLSKHESLYDLVKVPVDVSIVIDRYLMYAQSAAKGDFRAKHNALIPTTSTNTDSLLKSTGITYDLLTAHITNKK